MFINFKLRKISQHSLLNRSKNSTVTLYVYFYRRVPMRRIFVYLSILVLPNIANQSCVASQAAQQVDSELPATTKSSEADMLEQKHQYEEQKKWQRAQVTNPIPLTTLTEALTYKQEKIVYLGIGTSPLLSVGYNPFPSSQSYPEFIQSLCQNPRYTCKSILIDENWGLTDASMFQGKLPPSSFFVGEEVASKHLKNIREYLATVLQHGGIVCIAEFFAPLGLLFSDATDEEERLQLELRDMYNSLLKKFPHQVEFFEYRMLEPATHGFTVAWWQGNSWNERASNIMASRLATLDSFFQKDSTKITTKALEEEFTSFYNSNFPTQLRATTTLEQFMHEKLPYVFVSLAKTDMLPVLTFSIKKVDSGYRLEPRLSREPLDMFDLKQLDLLWKAALAREKERKEMEAKVMSAETSIMTTVEPDPITFSSAESVQEEKKKAESSCVIA